MINVNDFKRSTDNETIEHALLHKQADGIVIIPPRLSDIDPDRRYWLLDRAILIPENTTLILQNCTLKLSDRCRDNFFRSANCGLGIEDPARIRNIHIRGEGLCTLIGADHPRASGDSSKILACPCPYLPEDLCNPVLAPWVPEERRTLNTLHFLDAHDHSYGTDALDKNESQFGDWRGIGILFGNAEHFSISGLHMVDTHGWAISLESCAYGYVEKIDFSMTMSKEIDGMLHNMENQDGIDIRNGCHHITVSDITGHTGDDVIALTAIVPDAEIYKPGGSLQSTHVLPNDWSKRDKNIHDIIIRNVSAYSQLCWVVRLLPCNSRIWNVVIDGVIDQQPEGIDHWGTILLGEADSGYGKNLPGSISSVTISNVICNTIRPINVSGYLCNSTISNIISTETDKPLISVYRESGLENVEINNVVSSSGQIIG